MKYLKNGDENILTLKEFIKSEHKFAWSLHCDGEYYSACSSQAFEIVRFTDNFGEIKLNGLVSTYLVTKEDEILLTPEISEYFYPCKEDKSEIWQYADEAYDRIEMLDENGNYVTDVEVLGFCPKTKNIFFRNRDESIEFLPFDRFRFTNFSRR